MAVVKDPVRLGDRIEVYVRDQGCIAPQKDPNSGPCRSRWGRIVTLEYQRRLIDGLFGNKYGAERGVTLTLDHVPPTLGARRISVPRWMVTLCWGHGVANGPGGTQWATGHRQLERDYLERIYGTEPEHETRHDAGDA